MTIEQFRHWLQRAIEILDHPESGVPDCDYAALVLREAAATAIGLGMPELYRKCQFRGRINDTPTIATETARQILSECIAALPTEPTATISIKQLSDVTGWSRTTIYRYRKEGRIPEPRNEGKQLYWLRSELGDIL